LENKIFIIFTAGRGPIECDLAVQGIQNKFRKFLNRNNLKFKIVSQSFGTNNRYIETIVFEIDTSNNELLTPWLGTLQWVCKSPIRKYHKRKNWFIKSDELFLTPSTNLMLSEISVQAFRASGPGGQHRNKVETAIRIVHHPTGLVVTSSDYISQLQNRKSAMSKLRKNWKKTMNFF